MLNKNLRVRCKRLLSERLLLVALGTATLTLPRAATADLVAVAVAAVSALAASARRHILYDSRVVESKNNTYVACIFAVSLVVSCVLRGLRLVVRRPSARFAVAGPTADKKRAAITHNGAVGRERKAADFIRVSTAVPPTLKKKNG